MPNLGQNQTTYHRLCCSALQYRQVHPGTVCRPGVGLFESGAQRPPGRIDPGVRGRRCSV